MYKLKKATEKLEEGEINIIDTIKMLVAMKKFFERISEYEMDNFIDNAKGFDRMTEIDPEADFIGYHRRRLGPSHFDSRDQS